MDTTVPLTLEPVVPTCPVKRFTSDQYVEMIHAGILTEDDRVELIDGVITPMPPAGEEHNWGTVTLNELFAEAWATHYVFVQGTTRISEIDTFDPDLALVRRGESDQKKRHPQAADIDLVVEVAKSSLKQDQTKKALAYAKAGIAEYWIADINSLSMIVHKQPTADGYQDIQSFGLDAELTPLAFPNITIRVGDVLGGG
ncbi:MAG: Uma2 family endonuclease [Planctomycetota bacterium]